MAEPYPILGVQEVNGTTHYSVRSVYHPQDGYVLRRYNDFLWMRNALIAHYPDREKNLPSFPGKTFGKAQTDEIVARVFAFENLIAFIEKDPVLKAAAFYRDFYNVKDLATHPIQKQNLISSDSRIESKNSGNINVDDSGSEGDDDL